MQHQAVHGDACICHSCAPTTGTAVPLTQPYSGVCPQLPLAGRRAEVGRRDDYLAQIYIAGRPLSAPVIPGEARLQ
jgi:hypothetical protein